MIQVPRQIESDRLILRAFRESDAEPLKIAIEPALPSIRPWINSANVENTVENQHARIQRDAKEWEGGTRFSFLAIDKATGKIVGLFSVNHVDWKSKSGSLGYWLIPEYERKGLATEAAGRLVQLAKEVMLLDRITLICDVENARSANVAKRLGFVYEGTLRKGYLGPSGLVDTMLFAVVRGYDYE
ncbi:UNVERIFIED_CONTAM: hypothetical protein HDU68_012125 [Siphonaria sp. JEL0065]|nr:hypothetical protein HDU68_012125 [Siphonaria sp. JEL0065]